MKPDIRLACNMGVFTPAQRESHLEATAQLIRAVQQVRALEDGYELIFPNKRELISRIAEFISNERLCCPFLRFTLNVASNREPVSFALTGPRGTPEFLGAECSGAIP